MINIIWKIIKNNREDYELLNNSLEIKNCVYGYYYFNNKTREYVTVGLDDNLNVIYLQFESEVK